MSQSGICSSPSPSLFLYFLSPPAHRRAPPMWLRCQRKSSTLPSRLFFFINCPSPPPPPPPSDSGFSLSRFLKCCFLKVSPKQLSSETLLCIFIYIWTGQYAFYGCVGFVKWPMEVPDSFVRFFVRFSVIIVRESRWNHCLGSSRVTGALCNTENQIS